MGRRLSRIADILALLLVTIALTLTLMELSLRLFEPQQLIVMRPDLFVPNDGLGYDLRPNLDTSISTGEREVRFVTDADGHRIGTTPRAKPAAFRILALGDSFLQALQVDYEDLMTTRLEQSLSSALKQKVEIANAGVGGQNPNHYLIRARKELEGGKYSMVITFVYLGNDIVTRRIGNYPPVSRAMRHSFHLPRRLLWREWMDSVFYPINDLLEERSHLFLFLKNRARMMLAKLRSSGFYFPMAMDTKRAESAMWSVTADILESIDAQAAAHGIPVVFVLLPAVYQVDEKQFHDYIKYFEIDPSNVDLNQPNRLLMAEMEKRGLVVIDTTPALRAALAVGHNELYGRVDRHFGPDAHAVVAEVLRLHLLSNGRLSSDR